jgi:glycosyltransferase involved in cell wall biosynthesis
MILENYSVEIGIVIIGRNEGERLRRCLASVHSEVKSIVYVDSGSTDGSADLAERMGVEVVRLDVAQPCTAARARNEGFRALKALNPNIKFVQFIDGDCELATNWLKAALAFISERNDVAIVCGRLRERHPELSIYNRLCDFEWDTPVGEASMCGGNSVIRVDAFEAVAGFRAQLIGGEEPELCLRLREKKWKIWRLDAEMGVHDAAMTRFSQWWNRAVRGGYGMADVFWLHIHSPIRIYEKAIMSSIFWGGLLPLMIGVTSLIYPLAIFAALIYPIQICRIAIRRGAIALHSWTYAAFIELAMFAQLYGILRLCWRYWNGRIYEYKRSS